MTEPALSRNHTELMLSEFAHLSDLPFRKMERQLLLFSLCELYAQSICVPGDISSAAYFIAAARAEYRMLIASSKMQGSTYKSRFLRRYAKLGADISLLNESDESGEPKGRSSCKSSVLKGTTIQGNLIPLRSMKFQ